MSVQSLSELDRILRKKHEAEFDGETFPCGYIPYCNNCEENCISLVCAAAYLEWAETQTEEELDSFWEKAFKNDCEVDCDDVGLTD